jgi:TonB family protein
LAVCLGVWLLERTAPVAVSNPTSSAASQNSQGRPPDPPAVQEARSAPAERISRDAVLIEKVPPKYPAIAKEQHLEGSVEVNATIAKNGVPIVLTFVGGESGLAGAAMDAISLWRYKPALLEGKPVQSQVDVTVNFKSEP